MRRGLIPIALAAAQLASSGARGECPRETSSVTEIGRWQERAIALNSATSTFKLDSEEFGTRSSYARFMVRKGSQNSEDWVLHFRDPDYRPLVSMGPADFGEKAVLWTGRVPGARFLLDFTAGAERDEVTIEVFVLMPKDAGSKIQHSIQGNRATYRNLYEESDPELLRLGDNVGFLVNGIAEVSWCCSAVFLSQDLVLSNWHCGGPSLEYDKAFWNTDVCQSTLVDLSWTGKTVAREYNCFEKLASSKELDYVVFRVRPTVGVGAGQGAVRGVRIAAERAGRGDKLRLVHHPECKIKQLTKKNCWVKSSNLTSWEGDLAATDFSHQCDSEMGSSGAPLFNSKGELVGIHHLGFKVVDSETCKTDRLNKAVHISAIQKHIACCNPGVGKELGLVPCPASEVDSGASLPPLPNVTPADA